MIRRRLGLCPTAAFVARAALFEVGVCRLSACVRSLVVSAATSGVAPSQFQPPVGGGAPAVEPTVASSSGGSVTESFLRDVTRALARLNGGGGTPYEPKWVPLRQLTAALSEDSLEALEHFEGGMREVIDTRLAHLAELKCTRPAHDPTQPPMWFARIRPFDKRLLRVSNCLDALVAQQQSGSSSSFGVDEAVRSLPDSVLAFVDGTFDTPLAALQAANKIDSCAKWAIERDAASGEHRVVARAQQQQQQKQQAQPESKSGRATNQLVDDLLTAPPPPPPMTEEWTLAGAASAAATSAPNAAADPWTTAVTDTDAVRKLARRSPWGAQPSVGIQDLPDGAAPPVSLATPATGSVTVAGHAPARAFDASAVASSPVPVEFRTLDNIRNWRHTSGMLSVRDLMAYIPTFFIPVSVALECGLAEHGYTLEHFHNYLGHLPGLQLIVRDARRAEACFVRLCGFPGGSESLAPAVVANAKHRRYDPLPSLARPFIKLMPRPNVWVTLSSLLELAGKEVEAALPFQGADALMYFAQMQHIFVFSPERGGIVARRGTPPNLFGGNTPCPFFFNEALRLLGTVGRAHTRTIEDHGFEQEALREMQRCFPSWQAFCAAHGDRFIFDEQRSELMLASVRAKEKLRELSLEEQLEALLEEERSAGSHRHKSTTARKIRALRRRIAIQRNPDNPLLDPERLATAMLEFVPIVDGGHISIRELLHAVPAEIRDLLPNSGLQRFLRRFPHLFTLFDWKRADNLHVMRNTGAPLPAGALRSDFTAEEIVMLVSQIMSRGTSSGSSSSSGPAAGGGNSAPASRQMGLSMLFDRLPMSVRDTLGRPENLGKMLCSDLAKDHFVLATSGGLTTVAMIRPYATLSGTTGLEDGAAADDGEDPWLKY